MTERKYFGTDGIRGRVGDWPITAEFMLKLGRAAGAVLGGGGKATVLIGKDTRVSGYMFESALEAGLVAAGADVRLLGPMPTPAVAYLARSLRASAGIVISASHNPHIPPHAAQMMRSAHYFPCGNPLSQHEPRQSSPPCLYGSMLRAFCQ